MIVFYSSLTKRLFLGDERTPDKKCCPQVYPRMPFPAPPFHPAYKSHLDNLPYDLSDGRPDCCKDWMMYLVCRPYSTTPSESDIHNYCKHLKAHDNTHTGNQHPKGAFAFTLTMSPSWGLSAADMIGATKKLMKQKSCPVKKYAWYLEYGGSDDQGLPTHPHIHGMYETESGGRIEAKHFKRAWKNWDETKSQGAGFRAGYHRPVRSEEKYTDYIKKDGGLGESSGL